MLSQEQVTKGDDILQQIITAVTTTPSNYAMLLELSSQFFTNIPHRFGRSRPPVINDMAMIKAEGVRVSLSPRRPSAQDLLELMRDMVNMTAKSKKIFKSSNADQLYASLGCDVQFVPRSSAEFKAVTQQVRDSQKSSHNGAAITVKNVFKVALSPRPPLPMLSAAQVFRETEHKAYKRTIGNGALVRQAAAPSPLPAEKQLFHGSRISNWVGLLSRGIVLPKVVVSMGVKAWRVSVAGAASRCAAHGPWLARARHLLWPRRHGGGLCRCLGQARLQVHADADRRTGRRQGLQRHHVRAQCAAQGWHGCAAGALTAHRASTRVTAWPARSSTTTSSSCTTPRSRRLSI